ncbi:MAG: D-alanine--D-alanine ligase [Verrucomicrobiota bacterium]
MSAARICILTNQDLDAATSPDSDWLCDPRPYLPEAEWSFATLQKKTSVVTVTKLVQSGRFDLFFNLCDGAADEDSPGIEVVETLEQLKAAFTGATSNYYEPTREQMKAVCRKEGIDTPAHVLARTEADVERAAEQLTFPLFVKHHNSYASIAISRASRVVSPAGLRRQARKIMSKFGAALIEEYIAGDECTVLVAENADDPNDPFTYGPIQYRFPPGEQFKHSDLKWVHYDEMQCFPVENPDLSRLQRDICARFFVGLDGAGFGRCDLRIDAEGRAWMLEINPNCGVYYPATDPGSADLCLATEPNGHERFTRQLVAAALSRHSR